VEGVEELDQPALATDVEGVGGDGEQQGGLRSSRGWRISSSFGGGGAMSDGGARALDQERKGDGGGGREGRRR
jgi:hypothetical protein